MRTDFWELVGRILFLAVVGGVMFIASLWIHKAFSPVKLVGFTITSSVYGYNINKVMTNWPDDLILTTDNIERAIEVVNKLNATKLVEY